MNIKKQLAPLVLYYLRFFAKLQLKKNHQAKIIGIAGSAGKTSCQQAVFAALGKNKGRLKIKISNQANSESGIPLNILALKVKNYDPLDWLRLMLLAPWQLLTHWEHFDVYVIEMGIDSPFPPKNMEYLLSIVQPQIAIMLNAQAVHSQNFDQLISEQALDKRQQAVIRLIAVEKSKLAQSLPTNGLAIINRDDQAIWQFSRQTQAEILTFGHEALNNGGVDLQLIDWQVSLDGSRFVFNINNRLKKQVAKDKQIEIKLPGLVLGQHYSTALASAILLALKLGLKITEIKKNLEKYWTLEPGRSTLLIGKNASYILDSSYNASGMAEMIDLAKHLANNDQQIKRLVAIIGDMRELGKEAALNHQQIAQQLSDNFSEIYLVGPLMKKYVWPILHKQVNQEDSALKKLETFQSSRLAGKSLLKHLQAGDLVLVKGSQNTIYLEEATALLLKNKQLAKKLLCRQSAYWQGVKSGQEPKKKAKLSISQTRLK